MYDSFDDGIHFMRCGYADKRDHVRDRSIGALILKQILTADNLTIPSKMRYNELLNHRQKSILRGRNMDIFEKCYQRSLVDEVKEQGIYPYFHALESRQDVEVMMEGKRRIMLGSNNYLGLTIHPEIVEAGIKALEQYGTGCSGSRFLNGTLDMHLELEQELGRFLRKSGVVTFGTGFQSNVGIISALCDGESVIFSDEYNHASIIDGARLSKGKIVVYKHNDMQDLETKITATPYRKGLIVSDAVFSMDGDIVDLPKLVALGQKYGLLTMIDEAHATGVIGATGKGAVEYYGNTCAPDIIMGTLSKSLGAEGGFACSSKVIIEYLKNKARSFIFATSQAPATLAAAKEALAILMASALRGASDHSND